MSDPLSHTTTFHLFPALPAELRNQIWYEALPGSTRPALVPWKPDLWSLRGAEPDLECRFAHEELEVPIDIPMAFVSREARNIALVLIRDSQLETRLRSGYQYPVFTRTFGPLKDALIVHPDQVDDIILDSANRLFEPDMIGRNVTCYSEFKRIAMSATILRRENAMRYLPEVLDHFTSVNELLVVVNDELEDGSYQFESALGDVYIWTRSDPVFARDMSRAHVGDGAIASLMYPEDVREAFAGIGQVSFAVCPVRIRRP
jgi:hypothetical protein